MTVHAVNKLAFWPRNQVFLRLINMSLSVPRTSLCRLSPIPESSFQRELGQPVAEVLVVVTVAVIVLVWDFLPGTVAAGPCGSPPSFLYLFGKGQPHGSGSCRRHFRFSELWGLLPVFLCLPSEGLG